jgi:signal transduction histidine kinase
VATRKSLFSKREVNFEIRLDRSVQGASVHGDPFLLESAIGNVLQNALEATETGGRVILESSVDASSDNKHSVARICVIDTGCGIKEEDQNKVTVPFFSTKKNHGGLGLSMAARFIETHGGVLQINSLEGKGTEVRITLPTRPAKPPTDH